ncbi:MAG: hypothetical protein OXJ64_01010 [Boseongicola sp.]|nr:hypothetical protein [Boseongicola sp.]
MHASVAAILMCSTMIRFEAIPFAAGLSHVLGANLGSGFVPVWISRGMPRAARLMRVGNLLLRETWTIAK